MSRSGLSLFALISVAAISPLFASTVNITVNNPSFETLPAGGLPSCGPVLGCNSDGPIPDWTDSTTSGAAGQYQPGATIFTSMPDGPTIAYTNDDPITQDLDVTIQAGYIYTMTVEVGNRADSTEFVADPGFLVGGSTFIAATGTEPALGHWSVYTATFTGTAAEAGDTIAIDLAKGGVAGQADYDGVTASFTPTPEPSTYALAGIALIGLALFRRKLARSN